MRCWVVTAWSLAACQFTAGSLPAGESDASIVDGAALVVDGDPDAAPAPFVALHVPATANMPGTAALSFTTTHSINTTTLEIDGGPPPGGVTFDMQVHSPPGPELAVLHVTTLTLGTAAVVNVVGSRPLVVIASGDITIAGVLDASASANAPGPGGGAPVMGAQPGATGQHVDPYLDGGGGGGGHATAGGVGGLASGSGFTANGGAAGLVASDPQISVLAGGSGGGNGLGGTNGTQSGCTANGGAGGGAVQLSSPTKIVISGNGINLGGGGGQGGSGACNNYGSPGGGGSGGSLVLQAPSVQLDAGAVIAANGGGGGGGTTGGSNGGNGGDGLLSNAGGTFGAGVNQSSVNGGANGGAGGSATPPGPGLAHTLGGGNGGGGGGAAGRIAVLRSAAGSATLIGISSPAAVVGTY